MEIKRRDPSELLAFYVFVQIDFQRPLQVTTRRHVSEVALVANSHSFELLSVEIEIRMDFGKINLETH